MKTFTYRACIFLIMASLQTACSNTSESNKMYSSVLGNNNSKVKLQDADVHLLVNIYASGLYKMSLANEARIRSISPEAIQLANAVNDFYGSLNAQVEIMADQHGVTLPLDLTTSQKETWKELVKVTGWDFDKKFLEVCDVFIADDAQAFAIASKKTNNENIVALLAKATGDVNMHKPLIENLQVKVNERVALIKDKEEEIEKSNKKMRGLKTKSTTTK